MWGPTYYCLCSGLAKDANDQDLIHLKYNLLNPKYKKSSHVNINLQSQISNFIILLLNFALTKSLEC